MHTSGINISRFPHNECRPWQEGRWHAKHVYLHFTSCENNNKKTKARNENNSKACLGKSGNQNGKMEKWRNKQMMRHGIELGEYAMNEFEKLFWFYFSSCQQQHLKTNYPIKAEITSQKAPGKWPENFGNEMASFCPVNILCVNKFNEILFDVSSKPFKLYVKKNKK